MTGLGVQVGVVGEQAGGGGRLRWRAGQDWGSRQGCDHTDVDVFAQYPEDVLIEPLCKNVRSHC